MGWSEGAAELRLYDRDGKPVQGLSVVATFARPVQEGFDHSAALTEAGPGRYFATVALPLPGQWNMTIEARHGATSYRAATRVFVP
jgi:nitrogen fixation protein FixH